MKYQIKNPLTFGLFLAENSERFLSFIELHKRNLHGKTVPIVFKRMNNGDWEDAPAGYYAGMSERLPINLHQTLLKKDSCGNDVVETEIAIYLK